MDLAPAEGEEFGICARPLDMAGQQTSNDKSSNAFVNAFVRTESGYPRLKLTGKREKLSTARQEWGVEAFMAL
jgi:hypothetical protein